MPENEEHLPRRSSKNFVRTDIECTDRVTGEVRTFNSVTLPKGTVIDGVDVSYYQFEPDVRQRIPPTAARIPRHPRC